MKVRRLMIPLIILLALFALAFLLFYSGRAGSTNSAGINRLEQVRLAGGNQWISIRGNDLSKPVLLFLHGGPGSANLAKLRVEIPALEDHFIVVNWDQLGAGKSYHLGFDARSLSIEKYISDAHELTLILKERFHTDKIYLMGFSWGTVPGLSLASRFPEDYSAYIAVGQVVDFSQGEKLSLEWVRQKAEADHNTQAISDLRSINPAYTDSDWSNQLSRERKWLLYYGGVYHTAKNYNHEMKMLFDAPEYSWLEKMLWPLGSSASLKSMWPSLMSFRFTDNLKQVDIPILFISGRYDMNVPAELSESFFQQLKAPGGKKWVWCEKSAHDVFYDEPDTLMQAILQMSEK
jgi:pimeloyl-ACP methyl ester carboxylesterase